MPDIAMCKGTDCPFKDKCYRANAKPDPYWQSWFMEVPYDKNTNSCEHYWERKNETRKHTPPKKDSKN